MKVHVDKNMYSTAEANELIQKAIDAAYNAVTSSEDYVPSSSNTKWLEQDNLKLALAVVECTNVDTGIIDWTSVMKVKELSGRTASACRGKWCELLRTRCSNTPYILRTAVFVSKNGKRTLPPIPKYSIFVPEMEELCEALPVPSSPYDAKTDTLADDMDAETDTLDASMVGIPGNAMDEEEKKKRNKQLTELDAMFGKMDNDGSSRKDLPAYVLKLPNTAEHVKGKGETDNQFHARMLHDFFRDSNTDSEAMQKAKLLSKDYICSLLDSDEVNFSEGKDHVVYKMILGRGEYQIPWTIIAEKVDMSVSACKLLWRRALRDLRDGKEDIKRLMNEIVDALLIEHNLVGEVDNDELIGTVVGIYPEMARDGTNTEAQTIVEEMHDTTEMARDAGMVQGELTNTEVQSAEEETDNHIDTPPMPALPPPGHGYAEV